MPFESASPVDMVRLGLDLAMRRADVAGRNIALATQPGATAQRLDFAATASLLDASRNGLVAGADVVAALPALDTGLAVSPDLEVAELVSASTEFQQLAEGLNRHFGLLRLAVAARS